MKKVFLFFFLPLLGYGLSLSSSLTTISEPVFLATKGNPPGAERIDFDDSSWTRLRMPTNLRTVLGEAEDYWVRLHVYVPENHSELSALCVGFIYTSDAFYLNGTLKGGRGLYPLFSNQHDVIRFYFLYPLQKGETNILAWHIKGNFENYTGMQRFPIIIGPAHRLFWKIYSLDVISLGFLIVYSVIMMYFFLFFLRRPIEKDYLFFALFLFFLILYSLARLQIKHFVFTNYTFWKRNEFIEYYLLLPTVLLFFRQFLQRNDLFGKILVFLTLLMGTPGIIIAFLKDWGLANTYNFKIYQISVFPVSILYIIWILVLSVPKRKEALWLLIGFLFLPFGIVYDILVARGIISTTPIFPFVFFGFVIFFALVLANRFVQLYYELEDLNKNLEQKVHDRTRELEESNERLLQAQKQIQFELELAQRIQQSMMPKEFDSMHPVKLHGTYLPMEELGGDFYDVYKTDNRYLHLIIADVSGHGVPSALIAMMAKAFINYYSEHNPHPASVVSSVNNDLCRQLNDVENYLTLFYAVVDTTTNILTYVNAGHVTIFLLKQNGEIKKLPAQTPFLGKFENLHFSEETLSLEAGDKLVLYTDGITESRNESNTLFGEGHLMDILSLHSTLSPEELASRILEKVDQFRGNIPYGDDITLLVVEFPAEAREIIHQEDIGKLYEKALMNYKNNRLEEAEKLLTILLNQHTMSPEDTYRISILAGNLVSQLNKWQDAYTYWKKALDIHPENEKLRANVLALEKRLDKKT